MDLVCDPEAAFESEVASVTDWIRDLRAQGLTARQIRDALPGASPWAVNCAVKYAVRRAADSPALFQRATIKKRNPATTRLKTGDDYHGCAAVQVLGAGDLYRRVDGWWHGIAQASGAEGVAD